MPGAAARVAPPVLSESSLRRIRAAFYAEPEQVAGQKQAASSQRPAPLPRRVPGANDRPRPPARIARPGLPASLLGHVPGPGAVTASAEVTSAPASSDIVGPAAGTIRVERDRAAEPGAGHRPPAAMRAPAEQRAPRRASGRKALASRGFRLAGVSASVILITAGLLAFALSRHTAAAPAHGGNGLAAEVATRNLAAAWVADQVSRDAIVSCDPAMCQALQAHGIPDGDLLELRTGTSDPLGSDVIVATATVRSQFGGRLSSIYAPAVIASFGSGNLRITIRAIAPDGAAAYRSALNADLLARKASGAQLLRNPRIVASPTARRQLAAGRVDSRLLATIAGMTALQPVDIVAFGDSAPGAGAGSPLRSAGLADTGGAARTGSSASPARAAHPIPCRARRDRAAHRRPDCPPYRIRRAEPARAAQPPYPVTEEDPLDHPRRHPPPRRHPGVVVPRGVSGAHATGADQDCSTSTPAPMRCAACRPPSLERPGAAQPWGHLVG